MVLPPHVQVLPTLKITLRMVLMTFLPLLCVLSHSRVWLFVTPWTVACQAPLSIEFSRQEYWSGLRFLTPGDLPDPRGGSCVSCVLCIGRRFFTSVPPRKSLVACKILQFIFIAPVPRAVQVGVCWIIYLPNESLCTGSQFSFQLSHFPFFH